VERIISIGGIGGSGTRVVANALREFGYFIGNDLNKPLDNLLFTLFFKRQNILTLDKKSFTDTWTLYKKLMNESAVLSEQEKILLESLAKNSRTLHNVKFLKERIIKLKDYKEFPKDKWGWKEPNTHIVIEKLLDEEPRLKFIYVYRNGLDMAHSTNQNQLKLWGPIFLNSYELELSPRNSLKYWVLIHKKMLLLQSQYPNRVLFLEFESFCNNKREKLQELADFYGVTATSETIESLESTIALPSSVGRYNSFSFDIYDRDDLEYIKKIYPNIYG